MNHYDFGIEFENGFRCVDIGLEFDAEDIGLVDNLSTLITSNRLPGLSCSAMNSTGIR